MDDRTSQKVDMIGTVNATLKTAAYSDALASIPILPSRIATFSGKTTTLAAVLAKLGLSTEGITMDKGDTATQLIAQTVAVTKPGAAYAFERGNKALEAALDIEFTDLAEMRDHLIDDKVEAIRAALQAEVTAGEGKPLDVAPEPIQAYGVTQAKLDAIGTLIIACAAAVNAAKAQVEQIVDYLVNVLDRLMVPLKGHASGVYEAYTSARKIINRPGKGGEEEKAGNGTDTPAK